MIYEESYSFITYAEEGNKHHVLVKYCKTKDEHDLFMFELMFDYSYPKKTYKSHWIF